MNFSLKNYVFLLGFILAQTSQILPFQPKASEDTITLPSVMFTQGVHSGYKMEGVEDTLDGLKKLFIKIIKSTYQTLTMKPWAEEAEEIVVVQNNQDVLEAFNHTIALIAGQHALLSKDIEQWTCDDIKKLNAIYLYGIDQSAKKTKDYTIGGYRKLWVGITKKDETRFNHTPEEWAIIKQLDVRLKKLNGYYDGLIKTFSPEEELIFKKCWKDCAKIDEIPQLMEELLKECKAQIKQGRDPFVIAAHLHLRFTQIHPFVDANGRTARLLTNLILLKQGEKPVVFSNSKEYRDILYLENEDMLADHLRKNQITDMTPLGAEVHHKKCVHAFKNIQLGTPVTNEQLNFFLGCIRYSLGYKHQINICYGCGLLDGLLEKPFASCGSCKKRFYCSIECQKKDWQRHKAECKQLKLFP